MKTNDLNLNPGGLETGAPTTMARPTRPRPANGAEWIYMERERQIEVKRRTLEHDLAVNQKGQLAFAGVCYAQLAGGQARAELLTGAVPDVQALPQLKAWPWPGAAWKPSNSALLNLKRAGALIAAEIDRRLALGEVMPEGAEPAAVREEAPDPRGAEDQE